MIKCWSCTVKDDSRLLEMMSDSLSIYDQALYHQRQAYFETKDQGKIRTHSFYELWDIVKTEAKITDSKLDINVKQQAVKQVSKAWDAYIKAAISFRKNPKAFTGRPKMPGYLYKSRNYNIIHVNHTRFRKVDRENNSFALPCSDYRIRVPRQIPLESVREVAIRKYFGKTKIDIIYEDNHVTETKCDPEFAIGIDLGVSNLCAIASNDKSFSYVVKGGPLKSINQFYNKRLAEMRSELETKNKGRKTSRRIQRLTEKRNNKINHYMHCCSKGIISLCVENGIGRIVIGHNKGWKDGCDLGKRSNQKFVQIPFDKLIWQLRYKSMAYSGLKVDEVEESYTSKTDHMALEDMRAHDSFMGRRVSRGLFMSSTGKRLNADINGAVGILRKGNAITDAQLMGLRDRGDVASPRLFVLNV